MTNQPTFEEMTGPIYERLQEALDQYNTAPRSWVLALPTSEGNPCGLVGMADAYQGNPGYVSVTDADHRLTFKDEYSAALWAASRGVGNGHGRAFPIELMDALDAHTRELEMVLDFIEEHNNILK